MSKPDLFQDIVDFHEKFDLHYNGAPRLLPQELQRFRERFLKEELKEYQTATVRASNALHPPLPMFRDTATFEEYLADMLDGLVDLVYVALGTAYLHGFDFNEAWRRVHEANMEKVRATSERESKRSSMYDVVKPPDWEPADLSDLVADHAYKDKK